MDHTFLCAVPAISLQHIHWFVIAGSLDTATSPGVLGAGWQGLAHQSQTGPLCHLKVALSKDPADEGWSDVTHPLAYFDHRKADFIELPAQTHLWVVDPLTIPAFSTTKIIKN